MTGRTILRCIVTGALLLTLSACSSDDDNGSAASPSPAAQATSAATSAATTAAGTATRAATGAAATTTAAAGTATSGGSAAGTSTLAVKAGEQGDSFFFDPKDVTAKAGKISLSFSNSGQRKHTYVVRDSTGKELFKSNEVDSGSNQSAEFTIAQAGQYEVLCTLPGHANRGQRGTLTVTN